MDIAGPAAIFRNRSGTACSKDTLGDDFRAVRTLVFGVAEKRQLQDFRRSGTVEALAGKVAPTDLSNKMGQQHLAVQAPAGHLRPRAAGLCA